MSYLGFPEEWDGVHKFANWLRAADHTDWGLQLFVVKNNPNETFPNSLDNMFGYHMDYSARINPYLYVGPFSVATYYYGSTTEKTYALFAHEMSHVFGTADEYNDAPTRHNADGCDDIWGYLNYQNVNCHFCGPSSACLMRWTDGEERNLCLATARHLGWTDSDEDGNPDAIDPNST